MRIACIQHVDYEGPDKIAEWAQERGHQLTKIVPLYQDYPAFSEFDLIIVMGGPMGAYEFVKYPWLLAEKRFLKDSIKAGRSAFGVCLGAQLLAEVIGGKAHPHTEREVGWYPVRLTTTGSFSRILGALPEKFVACEWHGDTFDLPEDVKTSAITDTCENQAFEALGGRVVGIQFHLEWTPETLVELVRRHGDWLDGGPDSESGAATSKEMLGALDEMARGHKMLYALLDRMAVFV